MIGKKFRGDVFCEPPYSISRKGKHIKYFNLLTVMLMK